MAVDVVTKSKYEHLEQRIYWNGFNCSFSKLVCSLGRGEEREEERARERRRERERGRENL